MLLAHLKMHNLKPTKARMTIANSTTLACKGKNIVQQFVRNLVIKHLDFKLKFPARFEGRANTNDTPRLTIIGRTSR